ncbi:MAG TPA: hypothetical protein VLC53_09000 [Myxococcota bacterium]|nr:hypothetical protein [Myxococcota bacterium]
MRVAPLLACLAALSAVSAHGAEPLRIAGAALGPDGVLTRRAADVLGNDGPSHTPLLVIEDPPLRGWSRLSGRVETFEIESEAWLELAAISADGRREVARTLDPAGPAARLRGTAEPRRFELAVPFDGAGAKPVRLELAVGMLGPGVVSVSELRLEPDVARAAGAGPGRRGVVLGLGGAGALALAAVVRMRRSVRGRRFAAE